MVFYLWLMVDRHRFRGFHGYTVKAHGFWVSMGKWVLVVLKSEAAISLLYLNSFLEGEWGRIDATTQIWSEIEQ
jgi:hypothetical protein